MVVSVIIVKRIRASKAIVGQDLGSGIKIAFKIFITEIAATGADFTFVIDCRCELV
jgi:hypothetical protein